MSHTAAQRFASFAAACAVTLSLLLGVSTMASPTQSTAWLAKAPATCAAA